jgi:hypothetical protein
MEVNLKDGARDGERDEPLPNELDDPRRGLLGKLLLSSRAELGLEGPGVPRKLSMEMSSGR